MSIANLGPMSFLLTNSKLIGTKTVNLIWRVFDQLFSDGGKSKKRIGIKCGLL